MAFNRNSGSPAPPSNTPPPPPAPPLKPSSPPPPLSPPPPPPPPPLLESPCPGQFILSGGLGTNDRTGLYRQTTVTCNGKPTYQTEIGGYVLFFSSYGTWRVGPEDRKSDCGDGAWMASNARNCETPDCPSTRTHGWKEWTGSEWEDAPSLAINTCTCATCTQAARDACMSLHDGERSATPLSSCPGMSACPLLTITGLRCHASANADYTLQPQLVNNKAHWTTANRDHHLYWSPRLRLWMIDDDTDDDSTQADVGACGVDNSPPSGTWRESCDHTWGDTQYVGVVGHAAPPPPPPPDPCPTSCACATTSTVNGRFSHHGCGHGLDITFMGFEDRDWCDTMDPTCLGGCQVGSDYCNGEGPKGMYCLPRLGSCQGPGYPARENDYINSKERHDPCPNDVYPNGADRSTGCSRAECENFCTEDPNCVGYSYNSQPAQMHSSCNALQCQGPCKRGRICRLYGPGIAESVSNVRYGGPCVPDGTYEGACDGEGPWSHYFSNTVEIGGVKESPGDWIDHVYHGTHCVKKRPGASRPLDVVDIALYAAQCVASGVFGMINSVVEIVQDIQQLADGNIRGVCETMVGKLQGGATGRVSACSPSTLCAELIELGPEAPLICDLVFVGICIEQAGSSADPCGWLLDQFTGGNDNVCDQVANTLGLVGSGH